MKHVFVIDSKTFQNQRLKVDNILENIGKIFTSQEYGAFSFSVRYSHYRRNAMGIIQEEVEKTKPDEVIRVYAVGGEEILFDCLNSVIYFTNMQLAIVPYGETNDFLSIFGEDNVYLFKDISTLVKAKTIPTDVIRWGVNYALNSCYIGLDSEITKRERDLLSGLKKDNLVFFAKISIFFDKMFLVFNKHSTSREYKIIADDKDYSGQYSLIHIANGPFYAGKITGASSAMPDDGLLNVVLIKSSGPLGTLLSTRRYFKGRLPRNGIFIRAKKINIQSNSQMWIQLDNEYVQDNNVSLSVFHHAIPVVTVKNLSYKLASSSTLPKKA